MNNYQKLKNNLRTVLNGLEKPLAEDAIKKVIEPIKTALANQAMRPLISQMYSLDIEELTEKDWIRLEKELEIHFDVVIDPGIIVSGADQKNRDTTWWTRKVKGSIDTYYWDRYKEYIEDKLPYEVVKTIDDDTDVVMNNLANPEEKAFSRYGMVVGHVQSGKTGNYAALLCKAADAGYKFIVVVAGGMNNLRNQTQDRINEAFLGRSGSELVGVGKLGGYQNSKQPVSLTTAKKDFNKNDADKLAEGLSLDAIKTPIIIVIKKNTSSLKNVINWLKSHYRNGVSDHSMLLIDDESDYASINTKEEEDPTIINERIRTLLNIFKKSAYVAYTATPYANIFIDYKANNDKVGKDLFPEDFIYALDAPSNYFGAQKIFLDPAKKHLVPVDDFEELLPRKHKKDHKLATLPESLEDAIRVFLLNVAIRHLRGQSSEHNSMLVHITRFTAVHKDIAMNVNKYVDKIKKSVIAFGNTNNPQDENIHLQRLYETFQQQHSQVEFLWNEVISKLSDVIETIKIYEVHTQTKVPLVYDKDVPTNAIVVGGTSLSRGYTLEGLSVSYFLRTTIFYDTLMQMGRWFGYRNNYEDICKIYMTDEMFYNFKIIIEATIDLVDSLQEMSRLDMTPKDFGLAVQHHPDSGLQVTARNKLKSSGEIYYEMNLDGHLKETSWISKVEATNTHNLNTISELVKKLSLTNKYEAKAKSYLWRDIERDVVKEFLNKYTVYELKTDEFGIRSRMPIKFVKEYVNGIDTNWDIALYGGNSDITKDIGGIALNLQERILDEKSDYYEVRNRQVSSGTAEEITLTDSQKEELKTKSDIKKATKKKKKDSPDEEIDELILEFSRRKSARQMLERPLLMLHVLEGEVYKESKVKKQEPKVVPAFGISFPGSISSGNKNIALKVNKVYIDSLIDEYEGEESDD